jgi:hypothetical protein
MQSPSPASFPQPTSAQPWSSPGAQPPGQPLPSGSPTGPTWAQPMTPGQSVPAPPAQYGQPGWGAPGPGGPGGPTAPPPGWAPGYPGAPTFGASKPSNGPAIASLILGIIGLLTFWFLLGGVLGIIGFVLGIVGIRKARQIDNGKGLAIAGTILSALAVMATVVIVLALGWLVNNSDELFGEADPSTYDITTTSCTVSNGEAVVSGTIRNTTDNDRRFAITVNISGGGESTEATTVEFMEPRSETTWSATTLTSGSEVTCGEPSVRRALQR